MRVNKKAFYGFQSAVLGVKELGTPLHINHPNGCFAHVRELFNFCNIPIIFIPIFQMRKLRPREQTACPR